jgi:hypothetical protein
MKQLNFLFLFIAFAIISSCKKDEILIGDSQQNKLTDSIFLQEIAFPNRSGEVTTFEMKNGRMLSYEKIDNFSVFDGDIILSDNLVEFLKKEDTIANDKSARVTSSPGALLKGWDNSTVNFKISLTSNQIQTSGLARAHLEII